LPEASTMGTFVPSVPPAPLPRCPPTRARTLCLLVARAQHQHCDKKARTATTGQNATGACLETQPSAADFEIESALKSWLAKEAASWRASPPSSRSDNIAPSKRRVLIDWMCSVVTRFRLGREASFHGTALLDRYLAVGPALRSMQLPMLAAACLWVAAKFHSGRSPRASSLCEMLPPGSTPAQLCDMEARVLSALGFDVSSQTSFCFFGAYAKAARVSDMRTSLLAIHMLELADLVGAPSAPEPPAAEPAASAALLLPMPRLRAAAGQPAVEAGMALSLVSPTTPPLGSPWMPADAAPGTAQSAKALSESLPVSAGTVGGVAIGDAHVEAALAAKECPPPQARTQQPQAVHAAEPASLCGSPMTPERQAHVRTTLTLSSRIISESHAATAVPLARDGALSARQCGSTSSAALDAAARPEYKRLGRTRPSVLAAAALLSAAATASSAASSDVEELTMTLARLSGAAELDLLSLAQLLGSLHVAVSAGPAPPAMVVCYRQQCSWLDQLLARCA